MASPLFDECAETRMFRALSEISARILAAPTEEHRALLRNTAFVLRRELVELIQAHPIPEESDVARMQAGMGLSLVPREVS